MPTDDHVIRVILEGRDSLSRVLGNISTNFEKEIKKIERSSKDLDRGFERAAERVRSHLTSIRTDLRKLGEAESFKGATKFVTDIRKSLTALEKDVGLTGKTFQESKKDADAFARGLAEVNEQGARLNRTLELQDKRLKAVSLTTRQIGEFAKRRLLENAVTGGRKELPRGATPTGPITRESFVRGVEGTFPSRAFPDIDPDKSIADLTRISKSLDSMLASSTRARQGLIPLARSLEDIFINARQGTLQIGLFDRTLGSFLRGFNKQRVNEFNAAIKETARIEKEIERQRQAISSDIGRNRPQREIDVRIDKIRQLETQLHSLSRVIQTNDNRWFNLGRTIRGYVARSHALVYGRFALLVSIVNVLATVLIHLGVAFVELGASAIQAATAIGGIFVSAILQAAATAGILFAAFSRISKVIDLVGQQDKLRTRSSRDAQAQADAERAAQESLTNALENQKDAAHDLARARKDAARAIVDANFDEKDAALSLKEAQLDLVQAQQKLLELEHKGTTDKGSLEHLQGQVREAKARLELARQQGQEAEIAAASHQLAIAQQNLNAFLAQADTAATDLKDARLKAERAKLNLEQAQVKDKRSKEDAKEARTKGVSGADQVVEAQNRLEKATRAVAEAKRDVAKASQKETAAQATLQEQLADLTPAERKLFNVLVSVRDRFRRVFRPITDIIVNAFADAVQKISSLLDDQRIIGAARQLANSLGLAIDKLANFAISPEFREAIAFFLKEAARNVPTITDALINLLRVFIRIGQASAPLFRNLLGAMARGAERLERATRDRNRLERFFAVAGRHLVSWAKLAAAIGRVLFLLVRGASPSGKTLVDRLTDALNRMADSLEKNKKGVKEFFDRFAQNIIAFTQIISKFAVLLFKAFSSPEATKLAEFILNTLVPAFLLFIKTLGVLSAALIGLFGTPVIGPIVKFGIEFAVVVGLFRRLFPFLKNVDEKLITLSGHLKKVAEVSKNLFQKFSPKVFDFLKPPESGGFIVFETRAQKARRAVQALAKSIREMTIAQRIFNFVASRNPYILLATIIIGVAASAVELERRYKLLSQAFKDSIGIFKQVDDAIGKVFDAVGTIQDKLGGNIFEIFKTAFSGINFDPIENRLGFVGRGLGRAFGDNIKEGAQESVRGLSTEIGFELRNEFNKLTREIDNIKSRLLAGLDPLKRLIEEQLGIFVSGPTEASKEIDRINAAESARDRKQQIADAGTAVKEAQKETVKANREVVKAQKKFNNAKTGDAKKAAREELRAAKENQKNAKEQLALALKDQQETLHDAYISQRLDRLNQQDIEEREVRQKRATEIQKTVDRMFRAFEKQVKSKDWTAALTTLNEIQTFLNNLGIQGGESLMDGIVKGIENRKGKVKDAIAKQAKVNAINAKQENVAADILGEEGGPSDASDRSKKTRTSRQELRRRLRRGEVDLELAIEILKAVSDKVDRQILRGFIKHSGINIKPLEAIKIGGSAQQYLIDFLSNVSDSGRAKFLPAFAKAVRELQIFQSGGSVKGATGRAVPILAHAGEWVLNEMQQNKLASRLRTTKDNVANFLFGVPSGPPKGRPGSGIDRSRNWRYNFNNKFYNLVAIPIEAESGFGYSSTAGVSTGEQAGKYVWFIEFDDGAFGQISAGSALRIQKTNGRWFPQSVLRSSHPFTVAGQARNYGRKLGGQSKRGAGYALGGVVRAAMSNKPFISAGISSYADGGVVTASPDGVYNANSLSKTINQHFDVHTEGETDWNYVMRLGAIHAMG